MPVHQKVALPSDASRRVIGLLALIGTGIAAYLLLVQVRVVAEPWDPVFGEGSYDVLHSRFSEALPFPDAGVGACAYLAEAVLALSGEGDLWERRPALPVLFDGLGLGLALAGAGLVVLQATVVRSWCLLCLCSATLSGAILVIGRLRETRAVLRRVRAQPTTDTDGD